jgi:hypothetical protein
MVSVRRTAPTIWVSRARSLLINWQINELRCLVQRRFPAQSATFWSVSVVSRADANSRATAGRYD